MGGGEYKIIGLGTLPWCSALHSRHGARMGQEDLVAYGKRRFIVSKIIKMQ